MFLDPLIALVRASTAVLARNPRPQMADVGDGDDAFRSSHTTFLTALVEQESSARLSTAHWCCGLGALLRCRRLGRVGDDPELAMLVAALASAIVVVLVAGVTADYLVKEVQFWLFGLLLSGFWLSTGEGSSLSAVAASRSLPLLHVPAQRLP
jgi:hypothetical protein